MELLSEPLSAVVLLEPVSETAVLPMIPSSVDSRLSLVSEESSVLVDPSA